MADDAYTEQGWHVYVFKGSTHECVLAHSSDEAATFLASELDLDGSDVCDPTLADLDEEMVTEQDAEEGDEIPLREAVAMHLLRTPSEAPFIIASERFA